MTDFDVPPHRALRPEDVAAIIVACACGERDEDHEGQRTLVGRDLEEAERDRLGVRQHKVQQGSGDPRRCHLGGEGRWGP